jgi:hypothetical protein
MESNPQSQEASGRRPNALDRAATGIGGITSLQCPSMHMEKVILETK